MRMRLFAVTMAVIACQPVIDACTTFCVRAGDRVIFGRNYDFEIGDGRVMVNAAGLGKTWDPLESTCRHASLSIL